MISARLHLAVDRLIFNRAAIAERLTLAATTKAPGLLARLRQKLAGDALMRRFGCYVSRKALVGSGIRLPHPVGIVIGEGCTIGKDVTLFQNVTLGRSDATLATYPIIGDGVTIYAGAVVIGSVTVGRGAVVGANSVVLKDIPAFSVCAGVPARVLHPPKESHSGVPLPTTRKHDGSCGQR